RAQQSEATVALDPGGAHDLGAVHRHRVAGPPLVLQSVGGQSGLLDEAPHGGEVVGAHGADLYGVCSHVRYPVAVSVVQEVPAAARRAGSKRSRTASPSSVAATTTSTSAIPGAVATHGAFTSVSRPEAMRLPHEGAGGCTPSPRNE